MKQILLILVLVVSSFAINAQSQPDAIILKENKEYILNEDGSMDFRLIREIKLLSYIAFQRLYGETFITYNPDFQKLTINESYTIMAGGKKVNTPENAFNEVLPRSAANAPVYNNLREMVVTHTGLEVGAVIYLDYIIHTKKDFYPALMGYDAFAEASPVKELTFTIKVPGSMPLNYKCYNFDGKPVTRQEKNYRIYEWKLKDLPQVLSEASQPKEFTFMPGAIFSTANDMASIYKWFTGQPGFDLPLNEELKKVAGDLQKEDPGELKTVLRMQELIVNEVNLYNIPLLYLGYRLRTPVECWQTNGATEVEKALLFCTLLKALNVQAEVVAVVSDYNPGIGTLLNIENYLVKAYPANGEAVYLSVLNIDDQDLRFKLEGKTLIPLNPGKDLSTYSEKGSDNEIIAGGTLKLNEKNHLEGTLKVELSDAVNPWFELQRDSKKVKAFWRSGIGASDTRNVSLVKSGESKSEFSYEVNKDEAFRKQANYWFWDIPSIDRGLASWHLPELTSIRNNPFEIPWPLKESYEFTVRVPDKMVLVSPQDRTEVNNSAGKLIFQVRLSGADLQIIKKLELKKTLAGDQNYYKNLRELVNLWNSNSCREIVLKRNE